ncbi:hypothetical protein HDV00_003638 [Rhizophlyctis rosea]|nr:hypothetical protein HDV00_003638 [Rhizophlyctis rosea]
MSKDPLSIFDDAFGQVPTSPQPAAGALGAVNGANGDLRLTDAETKAFTQLFKVADTEGKGLVTPQIAVALMSKSKLPQSTLSEIWQQADSESKGVLTQKGFFTALKLIALAQNGKPAKVAFLSSGRLTFGDWREWLVVGLAWIMLVWVGSLGSVGLGWVVGSGTIGTGWVGMMGSDWLGLCQLGLCWVVGLDDRVDELDCWVVGSGWIGLGDKATPLPTFEGINLEGSAPIAAPIAVQRTGMSMTTPTPLATHRTGMSVATHATGSATPGSATQITQEERDRFAQAFASCHPINGLVSGENARELFLKSTLPMDVLSKIWTLVDSTGAGKLSQNQFSVAMFIITRMRQGALTTVPTTIPPQLFNSIAAGAPSTPGTNPTSPPLSPNPTGSAPTTIPPPLTAQNSFLNSINLPKPPSSPLSRRMSKFGSPSAGVAVSPTSGGEWAVKDEEKVQYDKYFEAVDVTKKGHVTGQEAYEFLIKSKLPQTDLFHIWDLADIKKTGQLSKDEFAVVMHLIKLKLSGAALPDTLPSELIPPSLRSVASKPAGAALPTPTLLRAATVSTPSAAPAFQASADFDLLGAPSATPLADTKAKSFGSMSSLNFAATTLARPLGSRDPASELAERERELGQRKFDLKQTEQQLSLLQPQSEELTKRREEVETDFKSVTEQKHQLTMRLSTLRATYEAETQIVADTEQQLYRERQMLEMSQVELAQGEQALGALESEKQALEQQLEQARITLNNVSERMRSVNDTVSTLRPEVEKLREETTVVLKQVELQQRLLESAEREHENVRMDFERERGRSESARARVNQLQGKIKVQGAITEREREKVRAAVKEREEVEKTEGELTKQLEELTVSAVESGPNGAAAAAAPVGLGGEEVGPPPPAPPLSSKPVRGELIGSTPNLLAGNNGSTPNLLATVPSPTPSAQQSRPMSASVDALGSPSLTPTHPNQHHQRTASSAADELNDLFEANKPKRANSTSRPISAGAKSLGRPEWWVAGGEVGGSVALGKEGEEKKSQEVVDFEAAFPEVPGLTEGTQAPVAQSVPQKQGGGFEPDFGNAFGGGVAAPPPAPAAVTDLPPPGTPSSQSRRPDLAAALQSVDFDKEFGDFGTSPPKSNGAGVPAANGVAAFDEGFPSDFSDEAFKFDAKFEGGFGGEGQPTQQQGQQQQAFGFDAFDPFAPTGPSPTGMQRTFSDNDINAAFGGGGGTSHAAAFSFEDAFGTGAGSQPAPAAQGGAAGAFDGFSFEDAFGSAPGGGGGAVAGGSGEPVKRVGSPGKEGGGEDDAEEVKQIIGLGFSREQALNALTLNDFNVTKATNYLLDAK